MKPALIEPLESRYAPAAIISVSSPGSVAENVGSVTFTVTLSEAITDDVTVQYETASGSAVDGSDFVGVLGTLTFHAGEALSQTVTVSISDDSAHEGDEDFSLNLTNSTGDSTIGSGSATVTITDNDPETSDNPIITILPTSASEGNGTMTFTVRLSATPTQTVRVQYATSSDATSSGAAIEGVDFSPATGELTFGPGDTEKTFSVPLLNDNLYEHAETFTVTLSNPTNGTLDENQKTATGTINDDDDVPTLLISGFGQKATILPGHAGAALTVDEGPDGRRQYLLRIELSNPSVDKITLDLASADGTAIEGSEYLKIVEHLEFLPGETVKSIPVTIIGDATDELDEDFVLNITGTNVDLTETSTAKITLRNDERHVLVNQDVIVDEGSGEKLVTYTFQLQGGASTHPVSFDFTTADGTAMAGSDYEATTGTVTFAAGETEQTLTVKILGDTKGEADEDFLLKLSNVANATIERSSIRTTITNDDTLLSISDSQVIEGGSGATTMMRFAVTLQRFGDDVGKEVLVPYNSAGVSGQNGATMNGDFTQVNGTLAFAPGETVKYIDVPIIGDNSNERDETLTITLQPPGNLSADAFSKMVGTGTIVDDEGLITISDATIVEGDAGTANMVFVVTLGGLSSVSNAVVHWTTVDGTAVATGISPDFIAKSGNLTFNSGSLQQTISIPIIGDRAVEGNQTFTIHLSVQDTDLVSIGRADATGTIIDNDTTQTVSLAGGSVVEGNAGNAQLGYTVSVSGTSESPVSVVFKTDDVNSTALAGVDYASTATTLVFYPGDMAQTVNVPVVGDIDVETDEIVKATLSNPSGLTLGTSSANGVIRDDDITVNLEGFTVSEGDNGTKTVTMKVTLDHTPPANGDVVVNFGVTGGTATAGSDYRLNATEPLVFTSADPVGGDGKITKTISFTILGDQVNELDETITVALNSVTGAKIGTGTATGTIQDDDALTVSIGDAVIVEGDGAKMMVFKVSLNKSSSQQVTVKATTVADSAGLADFETNEQTLTFAPGETTQEFSVKIVGDLLDEPNETFKVTLSGATVATIGDGEAIGTILDNDMRVISIADAKASEDGGTMTFVLTLNAAPEQTITVNYVTANGTAAAGEDYVAAAGTVTFNPGQISATITIDINADDKVEPDETFLVKLSGAQNATIGKSQATGRIISDESSFEITGGGTIEEDNGTAGNKLTFTVTRSGDVSRAGSVTYTTVAGTAVFEGARPDFAKASGTLNFAAGQTTKTITVFLTPDSHYENTEDFIVRLTDSTNGAITTADATGTILNNDVRPTIIVEDTGVVEGNTKTITIRLSAADETQAFDVSYYTVAGTARDTDATSPSPFKKDFTAIAEGAASSKVTFAKGDVLKTFTVTTTSDTIDEEDETFAINYSTTGTEILFKDGDATSTVTIVDNDAAPGIRFIQPTSGSSNGDINITEGFGNFTITPKLELTALSEKTITVRISTVDGTAVAGNDYLAPDGGFITLTFAPGTTAPTLSPQFTIVGDSVYEPVETFFLKLSSPTNANINDDEAKVTIQNDDPQPQLSISNQSIVEGDDGVSYMVFTVALLGQTSQEVSVNFATVDGTGTTAAKSTGSMPDFMAQAGTLVFAPGETARTISIPIIGDTYAEVDETFSVKLSGATNAGLLNDTATGTIQNGADSIIGIFVRDAIKTENKTTTNSATALGFVVELSKVSDTAVTFTAATRNGTAISGSDYTAVNGQFTVPAGSLTATVPVTLTEDAFFEATESMFLKISNPSAGVAVQHGEARGTILNDDLQIVNAKTVRYIDEDGDLATIKITKGSLFAGVLRFSAVNELGGRTLNSLDFTGNPLLFNGTSLSVTAAPQLGFAASGLTSDGRVDVGTIRGALVDPVSLQFRKGIDFGSITVEGDVAKIVAGDNLTTPAIAGKIDVYSLGLRAWSGDAKNSVASSKPTTQVTLAEEATIRDSDSVSSFLSVVNSVRVKTDVVGTFRVLGNAFGDINSLNIGGALRGTAATSSGLVLFTGTLGTATIGSIQGGTATSSTDSKTAQNSGSIIGTVETGANIGSLKVLGDIVGGTGTESGRVVAARIGSVNIAGDLIGGNKFSSSSEMGASSGSIFGMKGIGKVTIGGDMIGGSAEQSGLISTQGAIGSIQVRGSLIGGSGADSGVFVVDKNIASLSVLGDIEGGSGARSGVVRTLASITKFTVGGDLKGGSGADSGVIGAGTGVIKEDGKDGSLAASGGSIGSGVIQGSIKGGSADRTGGVLLGGALSKLRVNGSIIGGDQFSVGDTATTSIERSGFVAAGRIQSMIVNGDVSAGLNPGAGLVDSGSIRAQKDIVSLAIKGSVIGTADTPVVIAAGANGLGANKLPTPAIKSLTIGSQTSGGAVNGGDASYLSVVAGYSGFGTSTNELGTATNSDAQIGTVTFLGDVLGTNIVAGSAQGTDQRFGTGDDVKITATQGTQVLDTSTIISSIAKVVIKGVLANDDDFGIVAQKVGSVIVNGQATELTPGAFNDPPQDIGDGTRMSVVEVDS